MQADGTGAVTGLTESPADQRPMSWHPSGKFLAFNVASGTGDLMIAPMEKSPPPSPEWSSRAAIDDLENLPGGDMQ